MSMPHCDVTETPEKLTEFVFDENGDTYSVADALRNDDVVLFRNVPNTHIDALIEKVAEQFDLSAGLELQAGFAEMYGHRQKLSKYYMTVNRRSDYQCTQPHSEGSSFQKIQLVSFYCYENSTDGGVTTLFNTDNNKEYVWESIRERVTRGKLNDQHELTPALVAEARMRYQIDLPRDLLCGQDIVLKEGASEIPGLSLADVLASVKKTHSKISNAHYYAYWSSISRFDSNGLADFRRFLEKCDLYKKPKSDNERYDDGLRDKELWSSGVRYADIFKGRIFIKLKTGDFLVMNNLTWCHGVSNWTPGSGRRKIGAALA